MRNQGIDEGKRWLDQAKEDLKWARHLSETGGYHIVCFLSQQVAEKALKAFLYANGEEVVLGHSIGRLSRAAAQYDATFNEKTNQWVILDTYYIPTRYPNGLPDGIPADAYNQEIAKSAVTLATEVVYYIDSEIEKLRK